MKLLTGYLALFFFISSFAYVIFKRKNISKFKLQTQNVHMILGTMVLIISILHILMSEFYMQISFGWLTFLFLSVSILFGFLFKFKKPSKNKRLAHIICSIFSLFFLIFHMIERLMFL